MAEVGLRDLGLRDLGAFVPGQRESETGVPPMPRSAPLTPGEPSSVIITPPPPPTKPRVVFGGDAPTGSDAFDIEGPLGHLAELVAHRGTAMPLCLGLFGGAGSGKTFALRRLVERVRALGAASRDHGPFLKSLHVQRCEVGTLEGDPALALAAALHTGLRQTYPDLARELGHSARDPLLVLRETNQKLDEARHRLDAERRTHEDAGSRLARLTETVLYEAAGSQIDSYARAHRASLDKRLTGFGIAGDPIRNYKDLVRGVVEHNGAMGLALRALYAFKGQTRLIVFAVILALAGFGLGVALETQDIWLADLRAGPQILGTLATWLSANIGLLALAHKAVYALAAVAILANLWRAFAFVRPIMTGARLLRTDLAERRRDLEALYAHQTKRVDGLGADVERLTRAAHEAERRAGGLGPNAGVTEPTPFEVRGAGHAHGFFLELGRLLREPSTKASLAAPRRIVLALDGFETIGADRARAILETLHRVTAETGLVTLIAMDPRAIDATRAELERWAQVLLRLDAKPMAGDYTTIVQQALGHASPPAAVPVEAARSALDEPVSEPEALLLAALAPLAGGSPRAVKRFVNLYTVARLATDAPKGALAFMLSLDQGGTAEERRAVEAAMVGEPGAALDIQDASLRLRTALDAVEALDGRLTKADVALAAARATRYSVAAFV